MTRILAIDPGSSESAWVLLANGKPAAHAKEANESVLELLEPGVADVVVIEQIEPRYGLQAGWEVLDTARWVGRFEEASFPMPVVRLRRSEILRHLGVVTSPRAGEKRVTADAGIRAALIDRYGGPDAIGRKANPGPLYGLASDRWAALSVAVTYADQHGGTR